jgi:hypothetical protein
MNTRRQFPPRAPSACSSRLPLVAQLGTHNQFTIDAIKEFDISIRPVYSQILSPLFLTRRSECLGQ